MRIPTALTILIMLTCLACGDDDDAGGNGNACSPDSCYAWCEEEKAEELEECNDICAIEAYCTTDDECSCNFYPCDNTACATWCQENTDLDGGACDLLTCECF
jgi:hypothetical protein